MIIADYGKKFLEHYNLINKTNITAKNFCVDIMFPIFYGGNSLMAVHNSPFTNASHSKKSYNEKMEYFFGNLEKGCNDASMFVGGFPSDNTKSTSFNLATEYLHDIDENETFLSWIGGGLAIELGGINFLFSSTEILYDVFLGWNKYSESINSDLIKSKTQINKDGKLKSFPSNQINRWNSHWLLNKYSAFPQLKFNPLVECKPKDGLPHVSWVEFLFKLSKKYGNLSINTYAYKLGAKTNETYGYIMFELNKIDGFLNYCKHYLGEDIYLDSSKNFEKLFGNSYSVQKICENFGFFGVNTIKPKLFELESHIFKDNKEKKEINGEYNLLLGNKIDYELLRLYLMAKINLKDTKPVVDEIVQTLLNINEKCCLNKSEKAIEDFLNVRTRTTFLNKCSEINDICCKYHMNEESYSLERFVQLILENIDILIDLMLLVKLTYRRKNSFNN